MNAKVTRPVGSKRIENPIKIVKPSKHDENKEKSNSSTTGASGKTVSVTKKTSNSQEKIAIAKPQLNSKTSLPKTKQTTPTAPTNRAKVSNATTRKVIRNQPMKAIHQVQATKPVAEKNVMNTIHNVTVASPPSMRKEIIAPQATVEALPRERTRTRTLEPNEVLILKQSKFDPKITVPLDNSSVKNEQKTIIIHEPIAFEISFDKPSTSQKIDSNNKETEDISEGDYEDDFDSYESDFETESSSSSQSTSMSSNSATSSSNSDTPTKGQQVSSATKKLDEERDFDSGTFELRGVADKLQLDSIDEREPNSDGQNDSGFG